MTENISNCNVGWSVLNKLNKHGNFYVLLVSSNHQIIGGALFELSQNTEPIMLKKSKAGIILSSLISFLVCSQSYAGPFTNINRLGDLMMVMSPTYAFGMTVMAKDWKGTLELMESILINQATSEAIKLLRIEKRPNGGDRRSFPSGHAVGAFTGAMFVHKRYGWKPAIIPYAMSLITGWSRVAVKAHYWHDVLAGAAISALFTWILVGKYLPRGMEVSADTNSFRFGFSTRF